jgi:hypothetical protein
MAAINALLWQVALMLTLVYLGLDAFAWFIGGMMLMFWIVIVVIAKGVKDEQRR